MQSVELAWNVSVRLSVSNCKKKTHDYLAGKSIDNISDNTIILRLENKQAL